ncbi:MAG: flagellar hook capping FlgD N-terminal domain-containing protein [Oscillospiraceae bacterium]|nr:flagellar hook capping FlgD N-terminal domain-containing protein [Oscillospiraceae bacterium]
MATSGLNQVNGSLNIGAVYEDANANSNLNVQDFLELMIAQLQNQDFTNPVDDTQYVTQMAQIASMQQMQELAYYSKTNYAMGLVGKEVTVASISLGANVTQKTGVVEKVVLANDSYSLYIDGKEYKLSQVMTVNDTAAVTNGELSGVSKMVPYLLKKSTTTADIAWDVPKSTDASKYTYSVYYSKDASFDTVSQVKGGTYGGTFSSTDEMKASLKNLDPGTTYYANVIVSSATGIEKAYSKLVFTTADE